LPYLIQCHPGTFSGALQLLPDVWVGNCMLLLQCLEQGCSPRRGNEVLCRGEHVPQSGCVCCAVISSNCWWAHPAPLGCSRTSQAASDYVRGVVAQEVAQHVGLLVTPLQGDHLELGCKVDGYHAACCHRMKCDNT
jgi:hypothetical protein